MTLASDWLSRGGGRRASIVSAAAILAVVLWQLLIIAAPASAHAVLVSSDPIDGSRLTSAPSRVTFMFDEVVQLPNGGTAAISDDGRHVEQGSAQLSADGRAVVIPLSMNLGEGTYTVSYRVVSADGHVVTGAIRFGVNADPTVIAKTPDAPLDPLQVVGDAAQGAVYLGIVLGIGTTFAALAIWPSVGRRRSSSLRWAGWALLLIGTVARLLLAGPTATATGWAGVVRFDGIGTTLRASGGLAGLVRLALLCAVLPWVIRPERGWPRARVVAVALTVGILATVAVDSHAAAGVDSWLAVPATMVHLAAMAAWVGGLITLLMVVWTIGSDPRDAARLRRWSVIAFSSVAALLVTGEYLAWRQIDPLLSLADTAYGLTLLAKLVLVAVALFAAVISHRLLVRNALPSGLIERRRIRRVAGVETAVTIVIVLVSTLLVSLPPARTTYGPNITLSAPAGTAVADISVDGTHIGVQHIIVRIAPGDGGSAQSLTGTIGTSSVAGVPVHFVMTRSGSWEADVVAPVAGEWTIQLTVDLGDAGTYATSATYRVWR